MLTISTWDVHSR